MLAHCSAGAAGGCHRTSANCGGGVLEAECLTFPLLALPITDAATAIPPRRGRHLLISPVRNSPGGSAPVFGGGRHLTAEPLNIFPLNVTVHDALQRLPVHMLRNNVPACNTYAAIEALFLGPETIWMSVRPPGPCYLIYQAQRCATVWTAITVHNIDIVITENLEN